jgi:outer membrane protein TolC
MVGSAMFFFFSHCGCLAQELTIERVRNLAQEQSPYYHRARNMFDRAYWRLNNFKAGFKPQVRLNATVPTFYRTISPITQPDGSIQFYRVSQANNTVGISIQQNLGFLGGTLRAGTSLQRTDNFSGNKSSFFLSTPIQISYAQNSLLYNEFYWQKRLEPLLFDVASREFGENVEIAALEAVKLFLEAVEAQVANEVAIANRANADTLYMLSKERFKIGTVPQTDVLQLELNLLKANSEVNESHLTKENSLRNLRRILGLDDNENVTLKPPGRPLSLQISYEKAIEQAKLNRSGIMKLSLDRLEADQEVARAKGQNSLELSLLANLGTQQTAPGLLDSYRRLQNQQYVGLTLDVPIMDWGYRKSQIRLAKANRELVEVNTRQDEMVFDQQVFIQVLEYNQRFSQFNIAVKADTVAQQRLLISKERYLLGKLNIADLNLALEESVNARRAYIKALNTYWLSFYVLQRLAMYDFVKDEALKLKPVSR